VAKNTSEDIVTVDMTDAITFEPIPKGTKCLGVIQKWTLGKSAKESRMVSCEVAVVEPDKYKNRKIFDNISLDNEYTKARAMQIIMAALKMEEKDIRQKKFVMPSSDDMVGQRLAFVAGIQVDKDGQYPDKNVMGKLQSEDSYSPAESA